MSFEDRIIHLYTVAFRTFPKSATYTPAGGSSVPVTLIRLSPQELDLAGMTGKVYIRYMVRASEIADPKYGDQVTVAGLNWKVEKALPATGDLFELTLRRDERVEY